MKAVYVVSDLHMFCRRSRWAEHLPAMHAAAERADIFVFNGDTFDFKWSVLGSVDATVRAAVRFLTEFAKRHPHCHIHVNLGNHDHVPAFVTALEKACKRVPNLSWHPYFLRVGNAVFLHGDVAIRKMTQAELEEYRAHWHKQRVQGELKNRVYDAAFRARAHVALSRMAFPSRITLRRVAAYLKDIGQDHRSGVRQVYFGHTHVPVEGKGYRGVTFYNGGAPMEGVPFRVLKAVV